MEIIFIIVFKYNNSYVMKNEKCPIRNESPWIDQSLAQMYHESVRDSESSESFGQFMHLRTELFGGGMFILNATRYST